MSKYSSITKLSSCWWTGNAILQGGLNWLETQVTTGKILGLRSINTTWASEKPQSLARHAVFLSCPKP